MRVALVLTVKNEERLLRSNLLYHMAIGVEHIFVYFDNTTDNGKDSIADLDFVSIQDSVASTQFTQLDFLEKFTSQATEHHTARQCLNTYDALLQCEASGIDWLISVDADELVCTTFDARSKVNEFFKDIDHEIDVVYLQTKEALQTRMHFDNVFAEATLFKYQHTYGSRFKNIRKRLYDPFQNKYHSFSYWYGQHMGKGAIRTNRGIIPHNVHRYIKKNSTALKQINAGYILHYHAYDAKDFIKKFTNFSDHPNTFLSGNSVESIKLLLRDVVNAAGKDKDELEQYFKENLLFSRSEVDRLKKNTYLGIFKRPEPAVISITSVCDVFAEN